MEKLGELVQALPEKEEDEENEADVELAEADPHAVVMEGSLWKVRHRFTTVEWKERHAQLTPKQLKYFVSKGDKEPKQVVMLQGCELVESPENADCPPRDHSFALVHPKRKTVYLAAATKDLAEQWMAALINKAGVKISDIQGKGMQTHRLTVGFAGESKGGGKLTLRTRVEKYIASKAVTTKVGIEIIETFFGDQGVELLETLHEFAASQADKETADKLEKNILKMAAKIAVLVRNGVIGDDQLREVLPDVLEWCRSFISLYGSYGGAHNVRRNKDDLVTALVERGWRIEGWLQKLIRPHLRDTSSQRVHMVFKFYLDESLLENLSLNRHYETSQVVLDTVIQIYHKIYEGDTDFDK